MQRSRVGAHVVVAGLVCGPVAGALAGEPERAGPQRNAAQLGAVTVDLAGVRPLSLEVMHRELAARLADSGLSFRWRRATPRDEIARDEIKVVFLDSTGLGADRGKGILGSAGRRVQTIWIYYPNVLTTLRRRADWLSTSLADQRAVGLALGRILAHEVIHVLLPELPHTPGSLMAASLNGDRLERAAPPLEASAVELQAGARAWLSARGGWRSGGTASVVAAQAHGSPEDR
jgi:hypothetical protein